MENIVIKYSDDITIDMFALPQATIKKFLTSGINHVFGNEVASRVNSHFKKLAAEAEAARLGRDLTKEEKASIKSVIDTESKDYTDVYDKFLGEKWTAAQEGKLGDSSLRTITRDPFAAKVNSIAKAEVLAMLRKGGFWTVKKDPSMDEVWTFSVTAENPSGVDYTFEQLIDRRKAAHKPRIEKEATTFLAAEARKRKAIDEAELDF